MKQFNLTLQESMKLLGEMTLLDRFLFSEVMSDPEAYTAALQIILGQDELKLLTGSQAEKENVCVIMIMPFDLFGLDKYYYTFVPCCKEDKSLELEDGAVRIFLNTHGKNDDEITPELKAFLHYIESADGELAEKSGSDRLKKIHACVNRIKSSEGAGVKFMQRWLDQIDSFDEGMEKGLEQAMLNSLCKLI